VHVQEDGTIAPLDFSGGTVAVVERLLAGETIVAPGGIAAREEVGGREITPGCCAGLEDWAQWLAFERTGESPWMGHAPDPWLERVGDTVRLWSHGDLKEGDYGDPFSIDIPLAEFRQRLGGVALDLRGFVRALREWAARHAPLHADALAARFERDFNVTADGYGIPVT
jgi:hypothetical protein